uniref:RmlD-like substrate binding domain-containing protein n=1 Tax=Chromera velia CCMP2878 TaxID=1169474 RepID=A0A0G4FRJ1_9ALVE|eukprot:Cvel_463.t1-p1 / transcript=Cvel_463.t1 / gene=Cvel_463 / organism=Chromera_velia_CCMP2878 / gene_product=Methionine adenosyltransferase 2 subunit beta, putative / transcript_product=Methionine adenosyltransferase 2 subunit beta, putative / location=Cvel_scaffold14:227603-228631(-) / protein_length=343 / sequence_SO=supercontig / SO=protein_coding / is_pseudo=false
MSDNKPRHIVLFGGTGFLGWSFIRVFLESESFRKRGDRLVCASRRVPESAQTLENVLWVSVDIADAESVQGFLSKCFEKEEDRPDMIINAAAVGAPKECDLSPELSERINVGLPKQIATTCASVGASVKLVQFSTDMVFGGDAAPYADTAIPNPLNLYGKQKSEMETSLVPIYPNTLICRVPLLFGESGQGTRNGWRGIDEQCGRGAVIGLFVDEWRTPIRGLRIAEFILNCESSLKDVCGVLNVAGPQRLSRYEMGESVWKVFGYDSSLLTKGNLKERMKEVKEKAKENSSIVPSDYQRPEDLSLDSSKAVRLGLKTRSFEEEVREIKEKGGWTQSWGGVRL